MNNRDIAALMAGMAPVIKDYVGKVAVDLKEVDSRVDQLVALMAGLTSRLDTVLDTVEVVKPERGERGEPGDLGPAGERGTKGEDGRDGRDGLPGIQGDKGLDGKDGRDGIDGKDGLGFDDLRLEFDGERTVTFLFERGERIERASIKFPIMLYRGVWRDGVAYERGDVTTYGGSAWHANVDTSHKPEVSKDWQLMTKRGRDGKDGKPGDPGDRGPQGLPGLNGRNL